MKRLIRVHKIRQCPSAELKAASTTAAVLNSASCMNGPVAKWAWHYRVLLSLRERLLKERGDRLSEASQPLEPHSMDLADSATDEFDHDLALSQLSAKQDRICEVDEAIKRILDGTYGVCEETGKPIPTARLKAIPWARFVKESELRLEDKGVVSKHHLGTLGSTRRGSVSDLHESESEKEKNLPPSADESLRKVFKPSIESQPKATAARGNRRPTHH